MVKLTWTQLGPKADPKRGIPCERSSHGVSVVQNGSRLIVYGGEHVARTPLDGDMACWAADNLGDDSLLSWRNVTSDLNGSPPARIAHAQAVHDDKFVYIFGGRAGVTMDEKAMNDMWVLDCSGAPGAETWSQITYAGDETPEARSFHKMICIEDALYVFGGCGASHGRLADLWKFNLADKTWENLGQAQLRGRGGPNLLPLNSGARIGVVAGFAGEETADGQSFDLSTSKWDDSMLTESLDGMRPRSVCVSASFSTVGTTVIFGGEVDPSDRGHEGAGGFENDVVLLDEKTGGLKETVKKQGDLAWPAERGWSDGASTIDAEGKGNLYIFGGLAGDDTNPKRLGDLWRLKIE